MNTEHLCMQLVPCAPFMHPGYVLGCTGTILYALAPLYHQYPSFQPHMMTYAALSRDVYDNEHKEASISSFTLDPLGNDKSIISLQLTGGWGLGITTNLLTWMPL